MTMHGKVLIIENDPSMAIELEDCFQAMGYEPVVARNTGDAQKTLAQGETFSLISADNYFGMNQPAGTRFYRSLRESGNAIPFLFVTATSSKELSNLGVGDPNVLFIEKPFHEGELRDAVSKLLPGREDLKGRNRKALLFVARPDA